MRQILCFLFLAVGMALPAYAQYVAVRIHRLENYGPQERAFALQAAHLMEQVINSTKFRDTLLTLRYRGGEDPRSVYQAIVKAHEIKAPYPDSLTDNVVDMWLRLDATGLRCNGRSIGGDGDSTGVTNSCPNRIECWTANDCVALLAGHLMHEYLHQIGYSHLTNPVKEHVPYVVGYVVAALLTSPTGEYYLKRCAEWPSRSGSCQRRRWWLLGM